MYKSGILGAKVKIRVKAQKAANTKIKVLLSLFEASKTFLASLFLLIRRRLQ